MEKNDSANGEHGPANPFWRLNRFSRLPHFHVDVTSEIRLAQFGTPGDPVECPRGGFVERERLNHAKLHTEQQHQYAEHEISIAVEIHFFPRDSPVKAASKFAVDAVRLSKHARKDW